LVVFKEGEKMKPTLRFEVRDAEGHFLTFIDLWKRTDDSSITVEDSYYLLNGKFQLCIADRDIVKIYVSKPKVVENVVT